MKVFACFVLSLFVVVSQAEAVVTLNVLVCQGVTCQAFGPSPGPGPFVNNNIVVGDFAISGSVSSLENVDLSNAATTTISVQRLSTTNDAQGDNLDIWLSASGYVLPDISLGYTFNTTSSFTSSAGPTSVPVSFQGWLSTTNATGFPPVGSVTSGASGCVLAAGTDACAAPTGVLSASVGSVPFSMTTRTTFTVTDSSNLATYTSNAQANIVSAVPEPASLVLLGTGLAFLIRRRAKNNKQE